MKFRTIEAARGLWGGALLFAPRTVLEHIHHIKVDTTSVAVVRILGARHLTQAALSGIDPSPEVLAMGVWVDVAHAASAVGLAVADRSRARGGLTDAAVASVWASAGYRDLAHAWPTQPAHDRRRDAMARFVLGLMPGGRRLRRMAKQARRTEGGG